MSDAKLLLLFCLFYLQLQLCLSGSIFPDLTTGRTFDASSTCEVGKDVGSRNDNRTCKFPRPPSALTDQDDPLSNSRTWWQSENGVNMVSLTLSLNGFYFMQGLRVDFFSPLPYAAVIEISQDFGNEYHPLHYYSENCMESFGLPDTSPSINASMKPDKLICTSEFSAKEEGKNLLIFDPFASITANMSEFLSTFSFTNLRIRLLDFGSSDHDEPPPHHPAQDYAIFDISLPGACICNGQLLLPQEGNNSLSCPCPPPQTPPFTCLPPSTGPLCRSCTPGYFPSPVTRECTSCECNPLGSVSDTTCDTSTGQCKCLPSVRGQRCDSCANGFIGFSNHTYRPCIKCFCNGFPFRGCESDSGWYQAQVSNTFESEEELNGFASPGDISYNPEGFLEVKATPSSSVLILSFPAPYHGNKRTAFSQKLSLVLSLPNLPEKMGTSPSSQVKASLEITPERRSFLFSPKILFNIQINTSRADLQPVEVTLATEMSDVFRRRYFGANFPANDQDIRKSLANIISLRLIIEFPVGVESSQRVLRLHQSTLNFATDNITDLTSTSALLPLQPVNYVERCNCSQRRTGSICQSCADGFTFDPSFGGEFSRCTPCHCGFTSNDCDPVSGVCRNCEGNTFGSDCQFCVEGYNRTRFPLAIGVCDICALGYFDARNETCIPCQCHPLTSLSPICNISTGVCSCQRGVGGDRCDSCLPSTEGTFPNCDLCDECTDQRRDRINSLRDQISETVRFIASLNLTNQTAVIDLPFIEELLNLLEQIGAHLRGSNIENLSSDVNSTYNQACAQLERTQNFITQAQVFRQQLSASESDLLEISQNLPLIMDTLSQLERELANISEFLESIDTSPMDTIFYLELSQAALRRTNMAVELIEVNFTSTLSSVQSTLQDYNQTDVNLVATKNVALRSQFEDIRVRVQRLEDFVSEASLRLCGGKISRNGTCGECGGIGCGMCGGAGGAGGGATMRDTCDGLFVSAILAFNRSQTSRDQANFLLTDIQTQVRRLTELVEDIRDLVNDSQSVIESSEDVREEADEFLLQVQRLITEVEAELNGTRLDPDEIGMNVNATLSLELDSLPEQFFLVLSEINSTIEQFFSAVNSSEVELQRLVAEALERALRAENLTGEVVTNTSRLEGQLIQLAEDLNSANRLANTTQTLINSSQSSLDDAAVLLGASENRANSSRSALSELDLELDRLELLIMQNEMELERARNLTSEAVDTANQTEQDGLETESNFNNLRTDVETKLQVSEQDLENARDIQNRTCLLQTSSQRQLLEVENFIRIKDALILEQEAIRADIERVANEIEELDKEIRVFIARNTVCLDDPELQKRRKRRRRRNIPT